MTTGGRTGWTAGGPRGTRADGLRHWGVNLIMVGAFALVASGAAVELSNAILPMVLLLAAGIAGCLAGWRALVISRRRAASPGRIRSGSRRRRR